MSHGTAVTIDGRELTLTNLDKVLYPGDADHPAFTKAEVIDYYARIAPVISREARTRSSMWPRGEVSSLGTTTPIAAMTS